MPRPRLLITAVFAAGLSSGALLWWLATPFLVSAPSSSSSSSALVVESPPPAAVDAPTPAAPAAVIAAAVPESAVIPAAPATSDDPATDGLSWQQQLTREQAARAALQREVASLHDAVIDLRRQITLLNAEATPTELLDEPRREMSVDSLTAAGFLPDEAALLTQRWGEQQMEQLYLRDQAVREGWANTPRYRDARAALQSGPGSLRDELGEQSYDQFLYATGQPNRIAVEAVIESSPAQSAGLQPGDRIRRYDGQRIFDYQGLRSATASGTADDDAAPSALVPVEIERGDAVLEIYLPRGPMGIQLESATIMPE